MADADKELYRIMSTLLTAEHDLQLIAGRSPSRETALVRTKLQEARMWLREALQQSGQQAAGSRGT